MGATLTVRYILKGLVHGFHIGIQESPVLRSAKHNMLSAKQNPEVVSKYLQSELEEGNMVGPLSSHSLPDLHINRIGTIPKKHQPGKWRLITDLSAPEGFSVNDAIDPQSCSLSYITVQEVAAKAVELGKGSMIAKIDIKSAYRLIPICPHDCKWLGIQWQDQIYVDGMLPFGLRSAPKIFTAVADAMEWCVHQAGVKYIYHYLDDFAVLGSPDSEECHRHLLCLQSVAADLGVPLAPDKQDGPTNVIVFLGIIIDTTRQELRLPEDKLRRLLETITEWKDRKVCTRRDMESLVGILQHACSVIPSGKTFLLRAISLLCSVRCHHHIRLNSDFRSDMLWWLGFARAWNGSSLIIHKDSRVCAVTSDASGSWGCGAWYRTHWFQIQWGPTHITFILQPKS